MWARQEPSRALSQLPAGLHAQRILQGCWCRVPPPKFRPARAGRSSAKGRRRGDRSPRGSGHGKAGRVGVGHHNGEMESHQPVQNATRGSEAADFPLNHPGPATAASAADVLRSSRASAALASRPPRSISAASPTAQLGIEAAVGGRTRSLAQPVDPSYSPAQGLLRSKEGA